MQRQTNDNGVIDYKGTRERKDSSLEYDLKELITGDQNIKLNSKEKKKYLILSQCLKNILKEFF